MLMASHQKQFSKTNSARTNVIYSRYPCFRDSGRIQGWVLETLEEWLILQAIHSEECYFSARPLSKYLVVGRSKVFSSWIWRAALLLPSERLSTCLHRVLSWGEVGIVLEGWVLPSLSTSKTRTCSRSCLELVSARKWTSKLSPQSLPHWTWLK